MKNIVILGASGFLGTSLLKKLNQKKFKIKILNHSKKPHSKFDTVKGSVLSKSSLENLISDNDIVVNLTGQFDGNFENFFKVNLIGNTNILNIIKTKKNVKIIQISSIDVYGENLKLFKETDQPIPKSIYGTTKFLTEQLYEKFANDNNLDITILRCSNLYGPNKKNGIITNLIKTSKNSEPLLLTHNGKQIRDFLFVDDAADGIINAIRFFKPGFQIFNISSGQKFTILDVINEIQKNNIKLNYKFTSMKPDEFSVCADNKKSKQLLNFTPKISFQKGIRKTIENFE
ncbi:NAD-dependent epimerase/dehydratase family protein [Nitrosopumilus adriaticus]|uniref:NAD-dependent epimerase/dehydratase family protein n=1 Tax=Nitrosopumilus adriaticus TaxID=1580092 RepID=UPI00352C6AC8